MNAKLVDDIFHNVYWGADVALEQFFGGLGIGAFLFSVFFALFLKDKAKAASKMAALAAPVCIVLGGLFLILHLSQPFKLYKVFFSFNFTSPIVWGSWLQFWFFVFALIYASTWFGESTNNPEGEDKPSSLRINSGVIGSVIAIATGVYHGFLLLVFKGHPLWNTGSVVIMSLAGAVLTGISLVVLLLVLFPAKSTLEEIKITRNIVGGLIVVQLITIGLWISALYFGPGESYHSLVKLLSNYGMLFWGGVVFAGLLLPLILGLTSILGGKNEEKISAFVPAVSSVLIMVSGFILRYVILIAEQ